MINTFTQGKTGAVLVLAAALVYCLLNLLAKSTLTVNELAFCAIQCSEGHGYPDEIVYNAMTREVRCLCADGLELKGKPPSAKELEDGDGSSY